MDFGFIPSGGGGTTGVEYGAPADAEYVVTALDADLDNERLLSEGTGIDVDTTVASTVTVSVVPGEIDHNDLANKDGGDGTGYYHMTLAQSDALTNTDGTVDNADLQHSHNHNALKNFDGGSSGQYYHMTSTQHSDLTSVGGILNADDQHRHLVFDEDDDGFAPGPTAAEIAGNYVLQANGDWVAQATGGGAPTDASYVTLDTDPDLSAERVLTEGDAITISDGGSNSTVTLSVTDLGITAGKLATDAVETLKIKDLNVTEAKIANDAVTNAKIADDAVDTDQLADGAVNEARIEDDAVSYAKMQNALADNIVLGNVSGIGAPITELDNTAVGGMHDIEDHNTTATGTNLNTLVGGTSTVLHKHDHNNMEAMDGGDGTGYYHMTLAQHGAIVGGPTTDADSYHTHDTKADYDPIFLTVGDETDQLPNSLAITTVSPITSAEYPSLYPGLYFFGINIDLLSAPVGGAALTDELLLWDDSASLPGQPVNTAITLGDLPLDGTVTAAKLATDAVETAKIKDANVTYAKIQNAVSDDVVLGNHNGADTDFEEIAMAVLRGMLVETYTSLTWASTITPDVKSGNNYRFKFKLTVTGTCTIKIPDNIAEGMMVEYRITQNATGYTVTLEPTEYNYGDITTTIDTAANSVTYVLAKYNEVSGDMDVVAVNTGY